MADNYLQFSEILPRLTAEEPKDRRMSETRHTPLPWRGERNIVGADNTVVCMINRPLGGQVAVEDANRNLILRAVNSHEALLAAFARLEIPARAVADIMHCRDENADPILNARLSELWQACNAARAIIAEASGEKA
jgi:hypothetical protein